MRRIQVSPHYRNGEFQNRLPTPLFTRKKTFLQRMYEFSFTAKGTRPDKPLPSIKNSLAGLDREKDILIWLGHSSLFIQIDGLRLLIDPVLVRASPFPLVMKAFPGTDIYSPGEMPDVDCILITHEHYDHLDYDTVDNLKGRTGKVICGLGVGEHFEYWGYKKEKIIELDWHDKIAIAPHFVIHALPARHHSIRVLALNKTLWVSYMIEAPSMNIFISGDTGYDTHFLQIAEKFPHIDLAVIENGQYGDEWKYLHLMPDELVKAIKELNPERILTVHHSKYALGKHRWKEPLDNISSLAEKHSLNLLTPMIGEIVYLKGDSPAFGKWWENV